MKRSLGAKTLLFPTPVLVVGTYGDDGKPNVMTAAWGGICSSNPPCIAVSLRSATCTYGNIVTSKAFTVSIPSQQNMREADYFGIVSGKNENKFAASGLTPVRGDCVDAPYVKEFPMVLECQLLQTVKIGLHTQFIGEIKDVKVDDAMLTSDGKPDIQKIKPLIFNPVDNSYVGTGPFLAGAFAVGRKK